MLDKTNGASPPPPDETPPEPPPVITLEDRFEPALAGITIEPGRANRAVYSLTRMVDIEMAANKVKREQAELAIVDFILRTKDAYGERAPVFLDDAIRAPKKVQPPGSKIIRPGGFGRSKQ